MPEELPKFVDPRRLLAQGGNINGTISPRRLRRVGPPYIPSRPVIVALEISREERGRPHITGRVETEIDATCQRCLGKMIVTVEQLVDIVLVGDGEPPIADDGDTPEPVTCEDGRFDIERFVEGEVVLACPMIPMHDDPKCHASPSDDGVGSAVRKKPFADLADMLTEREKSKSDN